MKKDYQTGWYGRASEHGRRAISTKYTHVVKDGRPICGYRPHPTMQFQFCAGYLCLEYVNCPTCLEKAKAL